MHAMIPFKLKAKKKNPQNYLFLVTYMSAKIQIYPQEKKKIYKNRQQTGSCSDRWKGIQYLTVMKRDFCFFILCDMMFFNKNVPTYYLCNYK